MERPTSKQLVEYLKSHGSDALPAIQRWKRIYRPIICPFDSLINLIPEGQRVLDIGCGIGTFLQLVAEYRRPQSIGGIEINRSLIETSRSVLQQLSAQIPTRLEAYNGVDLPAWVEEYSHVLLVDVLHHIPKKQHETFLSNLLAQIKSGTVVIIKDIDASQPFWCFFNKMHDLLLSTQFTHERGAAELRASLERLGYRVKQMLQQRVYVYPHFTIVCTKG
jgi:2-polyprenyl-3-methyl-5-hydroxy-6-metoxy-1,4-benzoquinol methylase